MNYYPNLRMSRSHHLKPKFPAVIKVASPHAGYGKIVAQNDSQFQDVNCVLALHNDFYTAEPFIEHEYEFRVQKIGGHYRAFRRNSDSHWKNNWGNLRFEDHPMNDQYKMWVDNVGEIFGGMDILGLDVLHTKEGKDFILEVNDSSNGLMYDHEQEDLGHIRDLILERMNQIFLH